jgi:endonuclease-3 related protein
LATASSERGRAAGARARLLREVYERLLGRFGPQGWWPAETALEVAVGAVLTQNAAWSNVARAIANLKEAGLLDGPEALSRLLSEPTDRLEFLIRPSGYFRLKAARLRNLLEFVQGQGGSLEAMASEGSQALRERLMRVRGVGPETADSILLYALGKPVFVVDAYTRRALLRHGFVSEEAGYDEVQALFMDNLPAETGLFGEYHALFVRLAKEHCRPRPRCLGCPLEGLGA